MRGFTLIELMLAVAITAVVSIFVLPGGIAYLTRSVVAEAETELISVLRGAQMEAIARSDGMPVGVRIEEDAYIRFEGPSYELRDADADRVYRLPPGVLASGMAEVVFARGSGLPDGAGDIVLTMADEEATITIAGSGIIGL
jgi:prepilin-type N-terminal cleavage/methylation domain-containing protein